MMLGKFICNHNTVVVKLGSGLLAKEPSKAPVAP
jgi:hypothetical protein